MAISKRVFTPRP